MEEYLFKSKKSKNLLKLIKEKETEIVWIEECCIDDSNQERTLELYQIIKLAFNSTIKDGAKYFSQCIEKNEWNNHYNFDNKWKMGNEISDTEIQILCDIKYASEYVINIFSGKKQNNYFYESKDSDNIIKLFKDNNDIVWIEKYHVDKSKHEFILEFCKMLQNAFEKAKEEGGEFHSQYIGFEEWDNLLKFDERWEIIEKIPNNILHIQCHIDDATECIIEAFIGKLDENTIDTK